MAWTRRTGATTTRRRRRTATGNLLLGVSSAVAVGGLTSAAGAQEQEPVAAVNCAPISPGTSGIVSEEVQYFPPSETFLVLVVLEDGFRTQVFQGRELTTDSAGRGDVAGGTVMFPLEVGFAVYRDANANRRWDPGVDDTVYRGGGDVDVCRRVTLTPK